MEQVKRKNRASETAGPVSVPTLKAISERPSQLLQPDEAQELATLPQPPARVNLTDEEAAIMSGAKTSVRPLVQMLFNGAANVLFETSSEDAAGSKVWTMDAMRAILSSEAPQTPIQSLLVVQMVSAHALAMKFAARAVANSAPEVSDRFAHRAERLMNCFREQAEALARLKGSVGRQEITIKRLNVESGGRALVAGQVVGGGEAGGSDQ